MGLWTMQGRLGDQEETKEETKGGARLILGKRLRSKSGVVGVSVVCTQSWLKNGRDTNSKNRNMLGRSFNLCS